MKRGRKPFARTPEVLNDLRRGMFIKDVAAKYAITKSTVQTIFNTLGVKEWRRIRAFWKSTGLYYYKGSQIGKLYRKLLLEDRLTLSQVSSLCSVSRQAIQDWAKRYLTEAEYKFMAEHGKWLRTRKRIGA